MSGKKVTSLPDTEEQPFVGEFIDAIVSNFRSCPAPYKNGFFNYP